MPQHKNSSIENAVPYTRTNGKIEFFDDCLILPPADLTLAEPTHVYGAPMGKLLNVDDLFDNIFGGHYSQLTIIRVGVQLFDCVDPRKLDEVLRGYENDPVKHAANSFDIAKFYH